MAFGNAAKRARNVPCVKLGGHPSSVRLLSDGASNVTGIERVENQSSA